MIGLTAAPSRTGSPARSFQLVIFVSTDTLLVRPWPPARLFRQHDRIPEHTAAAYRVSTITD
jgi:hypothetical protein